jgi:hypothetical protein
MAQFRALLEKPWGKWAGVSFALIAVCIAAYFIKTSLFPSAIAQERTRNFIDAQTMKPFTHELEKGETIPVDAPSGKTGYPAELCYWNKDGSTKSDPTYVILNIYLGKPGPTFCPDCGRLVIGHNPMPQPGDRPPPTQEEYEQRHKGQSVQAPNLGARSTGR